MPNNCCSICGRPLTDPDSISKGIGPICYSKNQFDTDSASNSRMELLPDPINDENGIILKRKDNGRVATNVPWLVTDHSPDGYNWGYQGSGPADLALNIIENILRSEGFDGDKLIIQWNGHKCFLWLCN